MLPVGVIEKGISNPGEAAAYLTGAAAIGGTAFKAFVKVKRGEMGVRTHLGRPEREKDSLLLYQPFAEQLLKPEKKLGLYAGQLYGIVGPGIHPVVPFTHSIDKVSVLPRLNDLRQFEIMDDERRVLKVLSYVKWAVQADGDNPYRALFKVDGGNLEQAVSLQTVETLRDVLLGRENVHKIKSSEIQDQVKQESRGALASYGVELIRVGIFTAAPTEAGQIAHAMKDMKLTFGELAARVLDSEDGFGSADGVLSFPTQAIGAS